jgi:hypothetical protein
MRSTGTICGCCFVSLEPDSAKLVGLRMAPMQARHLRFRHASSEDSEWLRAVLDQVGRGFGSRVDFEPDGMLALRRTWAQAT